MATHVIEPTRETLHGAWLRERPPALTIDSGDTVRFGSLDAGWGLEAHHADGSPPRRFEPRDAVADRGHALTGPVAIRGAQPGMTLAVEIGTLTPGAWGWTAAGGNSVLSRRFGLAGREPTLLRWTLDREAMTGTDQHGHTLPLRPFLGVMGMPADVPGYQSTTPPRVNGGNIDCRELVTGSTLYLPIAVPGALFSTGDGHGAQADGEVSGTAIECPMDAAELTFRLRDDLRLATPRANTPAGWLTFGFHRDLDEAMFIALEAMLDLMRELHGLPRGEALALASMVVDLRVTQVVNEVNGVHAVLPHGALD